MTFKRPKRFLPWEVTRINLEECNLFLSEPMAKLIKVNAENLREKIETDATNPELQRVFPQVSFVEFDLLKEFKENSFPQVVSGHKSVLSILASLSVGTNILTNEGLEEVMKAVNLIRLSIGTKLNIDQNGEIHGETEESFDLEATYWILQSFSVALLYAISSTLANGEE